MHLGAKFIADVQRNHPFGTTVSRRNGNAYERHQQKDREAELFHEAAKGTIPYVAFSI